MLVSVVLFVCLFVCLSVVFCVCTCRKNALCLDSSFSSRFYRGRFLSSKAGEKFQLMSRNQRGFASVVR